MTVNEIKAEINEHYEIYQHLHAFFMSTGFIKGLHRAQAIDTVVFQEIIKYISNLDDEYIEKEKNDKNK